MSEYTTNGERPELAAIEVNPPEGFIGSQIMPIVPVADKSGTIYYATVTSDSAAQTSRTAGTAPTGTQISDSSTSFSCLERTKRGSVVPDEVKQMGGIANAEKVGSKWAKRQVMRALETSIAAEVLGLTVSKTFDAAKLQEQSQDALDSIRLYEGQIALVSSTKTLKIMVQKILADSVQGPVFSRLITGGSPGVAAQGLNFKAWMSALEIYLGVDQVLAGDTNIWGATAYQGRFAFVKLDTSNDVLSHKWLPVFGKTYQFLPDGSQPWQITSVADLVAHNNHFDATMWYDTTCLNSGATYLFDGVL
jgi:hypothetical protein